MEKKRLIIILFGILIPGVIGGITLIGTFYLPFVPIISNLMGNSLILVQIPLIFGGGLLFIGGILVPIQVEWAKKLIQCGAIIGIITWPVLLTLIFLRNISNSLDTPVSSKRKSYAHLLILPIILYGLSLLVFITDSADHGTIPWFWRGRNGLTFWETFWDQDVFWGELWFKSSFDYLD